MRKTLLFCLILISLLSIHTPALALQEAQGPVYIIQEGDNLWSIAVRFGVSIDDLMAVNGISDAGQISVGARLIIPGLEDSGIEGVLNTVEVNFGEDLRSLSRKTGVPTAILSRLNRLVSPGEIYAGMPLILVESETGPAGGSRPILAPGQSLLELAVLRGNSQWDYRDANQLPGSWAALPGEVLWVPDATGLAGPGALPDDITSINLTPLPTIQGRTLEIDLGGAAGLELQGGFTGHPLYFFPYSEGNYLALQGIHAMQEPGFYPLTISGKLANGEEFVFSQPVYVKEGDYVFDPVLTVSPETIDPAVTRPEDAQWAALTSPVTPEKLWQGKMKAPVPPEFAECYPSRYGSRRSYNGSPYDYFHTGLDFCGNTSTEILAPAAGTVVFAGPLTVRGNATVIDHGWGVYTAYLHQSKINVKVGERVETGQVIGLVGNTGRVTGPHLHWEVWVGGVQVDPMEWLESQFPGEG